MTKLELFQMVGDVFILMGMINLMVLIHSFKNNFENMTWVQNRILNHLNKSEICVYKKEKREMKKTDDSEIIKNILANFIGENQEPRKITIKVELLDKNMDAEVEVERIFDFKKK